MLRTLRPNYINNIALLSPNLSTMKCNRLLGLLLITLLLCSFTTADWFTLQNTEGNFKLNFPREPKQSDQTVETAIGPLKINMFTYEVDKYKDDNAAYMMMYSDYPDTLVNSEFKDEIIEVFFKNAVAGAVANVNGKLISQKKINYKGYPGRSAKLTIEGGKGIVNAQMILVKNRSYMLQVMTEAKHDNNPAINKFFSSFALLNDKK